MITTGTFSQPRVLADRAGQGEPVHAGHLDVGEHEVDRRALQADGAVEAVDRGDHVVARALEDRALQLADADASPRRRAPAGGRRPVAVRRGSRARGSSAPAARRASADATGAPVQRAASSRRSTSSMHASRRRRSWRRTCPGTRPRKSPRPLTTSSRSPSSSSTAQASGSPVRRTTTAARGVARTGDAERGAEVGERERARRARTTTSEPGDVVHGDVGERHGLERRRGWARRSARGRSARRRQRMTPRVTGQREDEAGAGAELGLDLDRAAEAPRPRCARRRGRRRGRRSR